MSQEDERGKRNASSSDVLLVGASGMVGLSASFFIYLDASSKGEEYLQDSMWIIYLGVGIAVITLSFAGYLAWSKRRS